MLLDYGYDAMIKCFPASVCIYAIASGTKYKLMRIEILSIKIKAQIRSPNSTPIRVFKIIIDPGPMRWAGV
ncbi:MAG: hypothetical protein EBX95_06015 [Acidimicrobiia bacterium]|nr:hypothetical protein [Acidimicrobiia bacterium]